MKGSAWMELRKYQAIWLIKLKKRADININKESGCMKCNYNLISMGVPMGDGQHKFQECGN